MKTTGFTARKLRILLSMIMLLIATVAGSGFFFVQKQLRDYATSITSLNADAQSGDESIRTLKELKTKLDKEEPTIELARSLAADSSTYNDRVINDLSRIASQSGMSITSFTFSASGTSTTTQPSPTAGSQTGQANVMPSTGSTNGITQKTIAINTQNPVSYTSVMTFLQLVETNPLKMHVDSVSMTKGTGNSVTTNAFTIQVYVRQ